MKFKASVKPCDSKVDVVVGNVFLRNPDLNLKLDLEILNVPAFFKQTELVAIIRLKDRLVIVLLPTGAGLITVFWSLNCIRAIVNISKLCVPY